MEKKEGFDFDLIDKQDVSFSYWASRGANLRCKPGANHIIPVEDISSLQAALKYAVQNELPFAVRGGGHCLENFVDNPQNKLVIDISQLKGVRFDEEIQAFEVMAGTTLGEMNSILFENWGVVLPSGEHPAIGIGGHIQGGAFGFLCRVHGLGADYLYAVELFSVNDKRELVVVKATREAGDPNRELWWAHTGGGAGNFGIVIRFWFRNPEPGSAGASALLPRAPLHLETLEFEWKWKDLEKESFKRLADNFGQWCLQHSSPGSSSLNIFATLHLFSSDAGKVQIKGLLIDMQEQENEIRSFIDFINAGLKFPAALTRKKSNWLQFLMHPFPDIFVEGKAAFKAKDAYLLTPFTERQLEAIYDALAGEKRMAGGFVGLATYGGRVNTVAPDATATFQRAAIMDTACNVGWMDDKDAGDSLNWVRNLYSEIFADSGGVPVPGGQTGGAMIPHPDNDLADPEFNRSGVPWWRFYYQDNYPRLQEVKRKYDPLNVFNHALSVKL